MTYSKINVKANLLIGDSAQLRDVVEGAAGGGAKCGNDKEWDQALKHKQSELLKTTQEVYIQQKPRCGKNRPAFIK